MIGWVLILSCSQAVLVYCLVSIIYIYRNQSFTQPLCYLPDHHSSLSIAFNSTNSLHFFETWRRQKHIPSKDFKIDHTVIDTESQGKDHLKLDELKDILENSLRYSIPWNDKPYEAVQVLLFGWEQNDVNADSDIQILKYFFESTMGYDCDDFLIQGTAVKVELVDLLSKCANFAGQSTPKTLSIFVYVGHGWSNSYDANDASYAKNLILLSVQSYSHVFATNLLILFSTSASEMESQTGNLDLYKD